MLNHLVSFVLSSHRTHSVLVDERSRLMTGTMRGSGLAYARDTARQARRQAGEMPRLFLCNLLIYSMNAAP